MNHTPAQPHALVLPSAWPDWQRLAWQDFLRLEPTPGPRFFLPPTGGNWVGLLAAEPVEILPLGPEGLAEGEAFIKRHRQHLVLACLPFELGVALQGLPTGPEQGQGFLAAYAGWKEESQGQWRDQGQGLKLGPDQSLRPATPMPLLQPEISQERYLEQMSKIQTAIREGEIYQINYTFGLSGPKAEGGEEALFLQSWLQSPALYSAFLAWGDLHLLSLSPESFLQVVGQQITTQPIKGTRPRGQSPNQDQTLVQELLDSEKEKAELMMILDLLRNDLGKVCRLGSVKVLQKRQVESLAQVHHTSAVITGELAPGQSLLGALFSLLPGGSISGCPKHRALQVIQALEEGPRSFYTGCLGALLPDGRAQFNLLIRSLIGQAGRWRLQVGGGITALSDPGAEWQEALQKARSFAHLLSPEQT